MPKPGQWLKVRPATVCDKHQATLAVAVLCGEVDSFGHEEIGMCQKCVDNYKKLEIKPIVGTCDWCKTTEVVVKPTRDYEEGSAGRLYDVCQQCRTDQEKSAQEDVDYQGSYFCPEEE
jgi:hypothetical protein